MRVLTNNYDRRYLNIAMPAAIESIFMILLASADLIMVGTLGAVSVAAVSIFCSPGWCCCVFPGRWLQQ